MDLWSDKSFIAFEIWTIDKWTGNIGRGIFEMRTAKIGQEAGQFLRTSGQVFRGRQPRTGRTETRTTGQLDIQIRTSRTVNSDNRTKELGYLLLRADGESGGYLFFMLDRNLGQAGQKAGQFSSDERTGFSREATSDKPDRTIGH